MLGVLVAPSMLTSRPAREYILTKLIPAGHADYLHAVAEVWLVLHHLKSKGFAFSTTRGMPLLEVNRIAANRSLLSLVRPTDLAKIIVSSPTLHLDLHDSGSNLEDVLSKLVSGDDAEGPASLSQIEFHLSVIDASIVACDKDATWKLERLSLEAHVPSVASRRLEACCEGQVRGPRLRNRVVNATWTSDGRVADGAIRLCASCR